jgi:pto-interacting protein 1
MRRRLSVASRLRHPNVVRLLGYTAALDLRVLLYEFTDMGTLHNALHGGGCALSWAQRVRIALNAARGLAYLHGAAVTHEGVHSSKVLLFPGFRAKIATTMCSVSRTTMTTRSSRTRRPSRTYRWSACAM